MDPFAVGRDLCMPGGGRIRWHIEDLRERTSRPLPCLPCVRNYNRVSVDDYITPLTFRLQWFPWPDAYTSLHTQRRVFLAFLAAASHDDATVEEYGSQLMELFSLKRSALAQTGWSVESISNQWWGINVVSSVFTLAQGSPGPSLALPSLADEYSLVPPSDICVNYVGNADISPLSFGELAMWKQAEASEQDSDEDIIQKLSDDDNIELLDLRGGRWTEIMYVLGQFFSIEDNQLHSCQIDSLSLFEGLKHLHELQATLFDGSQRLMYPSVAFLDSHDKMIPCSRFDTEDCFRMTQEKVKVEVGLEDTALNVLDETGLIAYVTRFSLVALHLVKASRHPIFFGAIALGSKSQSNHTNRKLAHVFDEETVREACILAEDLPIALASKFLLFPTAFLARLLDGESLEVAQAWWVAASLATLAEAVYSHSSDDPVRNVFHLNENDTGLDLNSTMCELVYIPSKLFLAGKLRIDWDRWHDQFMHEGSHDVYAIMDGLDISEVGTRIIQKSFTGQKFPDDPISCVQTDDKTSCEKVVERMPLWAEHCIGLLYGAWRHLVVFFSFRSVHGRVMQIGTVWKSFPVRRPTWKRIHAALVECLEAPWECKTTLHLGLAADMLREMGSGHLANALLTCMAVFGEIRATGKESCISTHLAKGVGAPLRTSHTSGPSVARRCLRNVEGVTWIAVTPKQWLGPFRQIESGVLHGEETRLLPPQHVVVNGLSPVEFSLPEGDIEYFKVGSNPLYMEEVAKLNMSELKFTVYCGGHVRGIEVPSGSLLVVLDKERVKNANIAAELGFDVKIVKGRVMGRYMPATYGKLVNNQRTLENVIENVQLARGMARSSRAIATSLIMYYTTFGNLRISRSSICKAWVPTDCFAHGEQGFMLSHSIGVSGRTRVLAEPAVLKIGLTATASLDLKHAEVLRDEFASTAEPVKIEVAQASITRYSTGTSPIPTWASVGMPGYLC